MYLRANNWAQIIQESYISSVSNPLLLGNSYHTNGMTMPGRQSPLVAGDEHRYGFQGQELDDEIKGGRGTSVNYTFRMHDPRVGRFFTRDPLSYNYPYNSPYAFSENVVINAIELEGAEKKNVVNWYESQADGSAIVVKTKVNIDQDWTYVKDGVNHAATYEKIYLDGKYVSTHLVLVERVLEGGMKPSAAYDYTKDVINGKIGDDWDYILNGKSELGELVGSDNMSFRWGETVARDWNAPDNSITVQDIEVLQATAIPLIGTGGQMTPSKTLWQQKGSKARIDVENPNPGKRAGNIHYQDANNTKYMYNVKDHKLYGKDPKSGEYTLEAPKNVQKMLQDPNVKKAIDKGKKYLNVK